ncbi:TlpA disulfide reductase family protein [Winogradskyella sp. UBA3174]|uniref:TlpA disulfide reductase family protein n=1 Tax=Winogradskyella sp. UBA3174 TaxID=1947785 RepID=UPI0026008F14|nr:TlpA disulfide reductase family protein [Winogradskyella sp. UBA3174]|tara:strand:+ start:33109 stop:33660 length:552 start_codon:yes stop_codon:yes gene_type:complete
MKKILLLLCVFILSCNNDKTNAEKADARDELEMPKEVASNDYDLEVYNYDGLEPLINIKDDKLHVVNFWATWCAPCVKELPYFEAVNEYYKNDGVEVLLVSLDFPKDYESKLKTFLNKRGIKSKVVALDDTDQNRWIPAINESWSGALPATIIYKGDKRKFYEQSFTKEELETEIKGFLQQRK